MVEKAVLVTVDFASLRRESLRDDAARELEALSRAAGLSVVKSFLWRQKTPQAPLLIGAGKAEGLRTAVEENEADVVIFESDLSPSQQRNLEDRVRVKTIDRTQLILDIFARRARSTEGKLQVELAQLKYLLPRLSGKGILLSRLGGGVGTRGPGEQKLEMDRRALRDRIQRLAKELKGLDKRRLSAIRAKKEKDLPLIALVGYTHAGKSTLFNRLTHSASAVRHQLFSTLDTTTRLVELPGNQKALLADTVGFVRDLPHHLIESFKATLEEVVNADLLLHVADSSRADLPFLQKNVNRVLGELGAAGKKTLMVLNKIDLCGDLQGPAAEDVFRVSAMTGQGVEPLVGAIGRSLSGDRHVREIFVPKERLGRAHFLYEKAHVVSRRDLPQGSYFTVVLSGKIERAFSDLLETLGT